MFYPIGIIHIVYSITVPTTVYDVHCTKYRYYYIVNINKTIMIFIYKILLFIFTFGLVINNSIVVRLYNFVISKNFENGFKIV